MPSPEKSQTLQYPNLGPGCSAAHTNSNSPQSGHFLSVTPSSMRMNGTLAPPSARCFGVSHCHCKEKATHSLLIGSGQFGALSFTSEEVEAPHVCKVKKHYAFSKPKSAHFLALIFDTTFGAALGDLAPRSTGNGTGGACARGGGKTLGWQRRNPRGADQVHLNNARGRRQGHGRWDHLKCIHPSTINTLCWAQDSLSTALLTGCSLAGPRRWPSKFACTSRLRSSAASWSRSTRSCKRIQEPLTPRLR